MALVAQVHGWFQAVFPIQSGFSSKFEYKYVIQTGQADFAWEGVPNRICAASGRRTYLVDVFNEATILPDESKCQTPVRAMSFNIRFDNPSDGVHQWSLRKDMVAQVIRLWDPDVAGLQEVLHNQLLFLADSLKETHSYVGVARDDGQCAGEYSPIFYNHQRLALLDHGTFWLSETPWTAGSRSWGSACVRICTWAKFQLHSDPNSRPFFVFNTHLDHQSPMARVEGIKLINALFWAWTSSNAGIICGDFNEAPEHPPVTTITEPEKAFPARLDDTRSSAENPLIGPNHTFHGWDFKTWCGWIDYIMVKPWIVVKNLTVLEHTFDLHLPVSDHYPIVADLKISVHH
jgi:endonuclease/exonuclease/phosphatase family metal-dependent hydrolase